MTEPHTDPTPERHDWPVLMTPGEVAFAFRVDPKTVSRWALAGKLPSTRTPGGHRRFKREDVEALLRGGFHRG